MTSRASRRPTTLRCTRFELASRDGLRIACARWDGGNRARGVIQIAHGMGEHSGRYVRTVEHLVAAGLVVYANDHRGHGRTALHSQRFGDFGEGGFELLVEDVAQLIRIAREETGSGMPLILMGHSMGSFAAQRYVLDHSGEIDGLILCGSGALDRLARLASAAPAGQNILNAGFEPSRTPFDWLTRDEAIVDEFIRDPLCFPTLRPASYASLMAAAPLLCDPARLGRIRADLPVYVLSGSMDPIGENLAGIEVLIARYAAAGVRDISSDFHAGARHEVLNEINWLEVHERLLGWIESVLERKKR